MKMHELDTSGSGGNGQQGDELSMYKRLADTANDCMAIIGRNNVFLYANTAFLHKFDLSNQSINGKSVASILPDPSYNVLFGRYIKRCFLGDRVRFEKWALLPNGKRCYIEGQIFPSLSPNGSITAVFRDNSRCKKAEENLVTEKNNHEKLLDHIDDAVFSFDQSMVFQSFNQSAETIFGKKSISVIGHDINEVFNSQNIGLINFLKDFTDSFSFRTRQANFYITNADSVLVPIFFSISRLPIADGSNHVVCTCKDLSTMKNQQEIIKRTRRIGAFGQLAGGVAHDYNNMLGVILGYCELLRSEFASTPRALEYLAQIDVAGKQGCELTKRLLSYSVKAEKYSPRKPLKELLASSLAMLTRTLPKSIDIRVDVDIDSLDISVGEGEFIDIMVNLCLNACHAMNDSGILSITAEVIDVDQDKKDSLQLTKSKCVKLAVSDNGCGMSEQQKKHIFESFYTTKGEDGSGLGLSQVCQFMKAAGGNVEVITHPMIGTTFNLYFPQLTKSSLEPQANNTDQPAKIETNSGNKRTILLVDDQAQLMTLSREFFELHGYRVFAVTEGADAIKIASEHYVDLILTDVVMPKWNGYELFLLIKKVSPWTLAIFTSGLEDQAAEIIKPLSDAILINKPYSHVELISVVDSCFANEEHQPYERVNSKDAIFLRRVIAMNNRIEADLYNHNIEYERVLAVVSNIVEFELEDENQLELVANIDQLMLIIIDTESTLVDAMSGNNIALLQTERNRLLMELCYVAKYKSCQCTLVWLMQSFLYRLLEHYIASSKALAVKRPV